MRLIKLIEKIEKHIKNDKLFMLLKSQYSDYVYGKSTDLIIPEFKIGQLVYVVYKQQIIIDKIRHILITETGLLYSMANPSYYPLSSFDSNNNPFFTDDVIFETLEEAEEQVPNERQ